MCFSWEPKKSTNFKPLKLWAWSSSQKLTSELVWKKSRKFYPSKVIWQFTLLLLHGSCTIHIIMHAVLYLHINCLVCIYYGMNFIPIISMIYSKDVNYSTYATRSMMHCGMITIPQWYENHTAIFAVLSSPHQICVALSCK